MVVCLARNISYAVCVGQYITMLLNIAGGVIYDDQLYTTNMARLQIQDWDNINFF